MNKKHCDLCDQVIPEDYYTLGRHVYQKGDFHYREICLDCIKRLLTEEEIEQDEI